MTIIPRLMRLFMLIISLMMVSQPVLASGSTSGTAPQNDEARIEYKSGSGSANGSCPVFTSVILTAVYCVQISVVTATMLFLMPITDLMVPITSIILVMVAMMFGYVLMTGEQELNRKTLAVLIKIGVVLLFGYDFGGFAVQTFGASVSLQDAVVETLWDDPHCPVDSFTRGAPAYDYISGSGAEVWGALDCILGKIFGFGGPFMLATSIFGLLGSLLGSGTMGVMVFFLGLGTLISIFIFAIRCAYVFLVCYIFIGFLIVISPMVMPMILFQTTRNMFDAWLKNLTVALLLPGVIFTYLCMVLPLLDEVVLGNDPNDRHSLQQILSDEDIQNAYRNMQQRCSMPSQNTDFSWYREVAGSGINIESWVQGPFRNVLVPSNSAATDGCQMMQMTSADFGEQHVFKLWQVAFSLLRVFLVGILITMMMNMLPDLVAGWINGGNAILGAAGQGLPGQQQLNQMMQRSRQSMMRNAGNSGVAGSIASGLGIGRR
jgi:hypothetical protein